MTQEAKHTPLPYRQEGPDHNIAQPYIEIVGKNGEYVCRIACDEEVMKPSLATKRKETAAFIVRACNSHYELLEALKTARNKVAEYAHLAEKRGHCGYYMADEQIEAAIAKAVGAA